MLPKDDRTIRRDVQDLLGSEANKRKASLVIIAGVDIGRKFTINRPEMTIGRGEQCPIFIDDEDVSRNHARLAVSEDGIFLEDLDSTNGTLVNGVKIKNCFLRDGDRVQFGTTTVLKFHFMNPLEDQFNEQLYVAANKDALTGTYNKKYFMDRLRMEMSYTKRHLKPLSLIMFDVDHFKNLNDTHGHIAGDAALKHLASLVESIKRQEDLFCRFGGEEFMLLLRDTNKPASVQFAEKIRASIADTSFVFDGKTIPLTVSLGVETFSGTNYMDEDLFLRATDEQLYRAKHQGRNQVQYQLGDENP